MFQSARLKLTAWYLLIIMFITLLFSIILYHVVAEEVERSLRAQQFRIYRIEQYPSVFTIPPPIDPQVLNDARERIIFILIYMNFGIFIVAGGLGYFLAGRTLKPIKNMVDEQNRFITDASHELRTPLTALKSEIEVYLRAKTHSLSEATTLLESNLEEVNNLQILSESLLKLAYDQMSNGKNFFEEVSIAWILQTAEKKILPLAKQKNITFVLQTKNYLLQGDKQSLVQLFTILLDNAVKYSYEKTTVSISSETGAHALLIHIADQGTGISKEDLPCIFDRFYRTDSSRTKQNVSGYGLGLSIAKKIVTLHQGSITVRSELGKGTTFTVQLPWKG